MALVEWTSFARLLGEVYAAPAQVPVGPGLEEALSDRLSFRRLVGLALADPVPDHSTLSRLAAS